MGCVLVRDEEIVAEGWHDHLGGLHAEQMAIADAESKGISTRGATAYVTLEPCNHFGRTPPCTESLLWAGVEKIVIGAMDPNPTVRGGGCGSLGKNGVEVSHGLLREECEKQMAEFIHWCKERRPLVTLKASTDMEGRVDGPQDQPSERFSSEEAMSKPCTTSSTPSSSRSNSRVMSPVFPQGPNRSHSYSNESPLVALLK